MLAPKDVLDSVCAHEVCHLLEMNHSARFYSEVYRIFPEYRKHYAWLKKNGSILQSMVPRGE
jgi:predicted metal-dependent hydrolase